MLFLYTNLTRIGFFGERCGDLVEEMIYVQRVRGCYDRAGFKLEKINKYNGTFAEIDY